MIVGILLFFAVLYFSVHRHYKKWKKKKPINHYRAWMMRATALMPSVVWISGPSLLSLGISALLEATVFLLLFDGFYNNIRGFNWWFLGSVDPDDAWADKIQRKIPLKYLKLLKVGIPATLLILYILTK